MRYMLAIAVLGVIGTWSVQAALSPNLLLYGDFEDPQSVKTQSSPLTDEEWSAGAAPIPAGGFHPQFDLGRWIGTWGITSFPDPREAWTEGQSPATLNRSADEGDNRFLEGVSLNPWVGVIFAAPPNMAAGPARLDFDFYFNYWDPVNLASTQQIFQVVIHGLHAADLPRWQDRFLIENGGDWDNSDPPLGSPQANWVRVYTGAEFNSQLHDEDLFGDPQRPYLPDQGDQWHAYSSGWTEISPPGYELQPGEGEDGLTLDYDGEFTIDDAYDYFYVTVRMTSYYVDHPYFLFFGGRPSDAMSVAIDNMSFQVSLADVPPPQAGDFSIDALVNTEDINPFILALTNTTAWLNYARPLLPDGLTDQQIIDYADPNGDGSINTEDIAWFICWLTTPGSCGGGGDAAIIPEPASLSLLAAGALGLVRRRR